jgi:SAM-dependent methyltransferase
MGQNIDADEAKTPHQGPRPFSYSKITAIVHEMGWRSTLVGSILFVLRLRRSWWYDVVHNVKTRHRMPLSKLNIVGEQAAHAQFYEATDSTCLTGLLRGLPIQHNRFLFVDLGAGKGKTLMLAAELPFKKVLGLELSPVLSDFARRNCTTFRSKKQACKNLEVICGDAAEFAFPSDPLVIYMFNPFSELILSRVMTNLMQSYGEHPRDVFVIYHNPAHSHVIENCRFFEVFLAGRDEWDYRKMPYKIFRAGTRAAAKTAH